MKRKLFSTLLCAFALLLLMGAGVEQDSAAAAIVIEEESASADGSAQVLETGIQTGIEAQDTEEISADEIYLEAINSDGTQTSVTAEPAVALDHTLLVNGQPVPADTGKTVEQGTTYVALAAMAQTLDYGFGKADPSVELVMGPNITDWPKMQPLAENLLVLRPWTPA